MAQVDYRFSLDYFREDGSPVGQVSVSIDWQPALEWTHFEGVRSGRLPAVMNPGPAWIEPVWDIRSGEPYVQGFRVAMSANSDAPFCREITTAYLHGLARETSAHWVKQGKLAAGEIFKYRVCAFAGANESQPNAVESCAVEEVVQPLALVDSTVEKLLAGAQLAGKESMHSDDHRVFIPSHVLDEVMAAAADAGDLETGGVLVGKLHRDPSIPDIFVEVTAQIYAPHTLAQHAKLTFTAETWAAVRATIELRKKQELMIGWWHSHPDFCRKCPSVRRVQCAYSRPFFSADDCALQRAMFSRAFNIGLLEAYNASGELTHTLFGWRGGVVSPRGFYIGSGNYSKNNSREAIHGAAK